MSSHLTVEEFDFRQNLKPFGLHAIFGGKRHGWGHDASDFARAISCVLRSAHPTTANIVIVCNENDAKLWEPQCKKHEVWKLITVDEISRCLSALIRKQKQRVKGQNAIYWTAFPEKYKVRLWFDSCMRLELLSKTCPTFRRIVSQRRNLQVEVFIIGETLQCITDVFGVQECDTFVCLKEDNCWRSLRTLRAVNTTIGSLSRNMATIVYHKTTNDEGCLVVVKDEQHDQNKKLYFSKKSFLERRQPSPFNSSDDEDDYEDNKPQHSDREENAEHEKFFPKFRKDQKSRYFSKPNLFTRVYPSHDRATEQHEERCEEKQGLVASLALAMKEAEERTDDAIAQLHASLAASHRMLHLKFAQIMAEALRLAEKASDEQQRKEDEDVEDEDEDEDQGEEDDDDTTPIRTIQPTKIRRANRLF